jgi:hypothetical protein
MGLHRRKRTEKLREFSIDGFNFLDKLTGKIIQEKLRVKT